MPIVPAGTTNLAAAGVPNIYVNIQQPNPLLNGVPTNIIGVVGVASWGPVNSPFVVGSMQEYVQFFGNPLAQQYDMGTQVYNAIQQGANDFRCVRVTDGTDTYASVQIKDVNAVEGALFSSFYTGTLPNGNCNVVVAPGSGATQAAPTYKISVYFNGGTPEVFDNIGGSGAQLWSNIVDAINLGQNNIRGPSQLITAATENGIGSVNVVAGGSYTSVPNAVLSGPGSGATLVVHMEGLSDAVAAPGSGYVQADTITLTGGTHSAAAVLTVQTTQLASLAVNAGGSGYQVGDTITLAGGTATTPAVLTVATVSTGAVATFTITNPGAYSVNASSFTQASTSGSGTGATFNTAEYGVLTASVTTPGSYTVLPANPVAQGSTSGSGTGATFTMAWTVLSITVSAGGTGFTDKSALSLVGIGSGGIANLVLTTAAAAPNLTSYVLANGTNGNGGVVDATLIGSDVSTPRTGMYALRKTGVSIGVLADQTNPTAYWASQQAFGLSEGVYMIIPMAANNQDNLNNAVSIQQSSGLNSYSAKLMMGDWVYIQDPFNNITRLVSPQGFVAGILATQLPSNSSLNKIMNGIIGTQKSSENRVYSDADLLLLQTNRIDVITNYIPVSPSSGTFGVRLGVNSSPNITTNGDNYTRMINFLAETFNAGLGLFVGLPQTPDLQSQAAGTLSTFLQNLVQLGLIGTVNGSPPFRVTLDSSNNPPNRVALGFMQADVQVTLFSIVLNFIVNLQAGQSVQIQVLPSQLAA